MAQMHGVVSFLVDPTTRVRAGSQFVSYLKGMGTTHIKAPIRTAANGDLPTDLYLLSVADHQAQGIPVLPLLDRAFRPVGGETATLYPNTPLNTSGDRRTSPWIDGFTLRATGFLRQMHARCGTTRAICWNEADQLALLATGTNPDPNGLKANALNPAVFGALCWQAALRWRSAGIAQTYCGGLSVLPQTGLDDRNPYMALYMEETYRALEALGCHAPWPWAGFVANMEGWWTTEHLAAALAEIRKVMARHGDTGTILIGEWLTTNHDYIDHQALLAPTYAAFGATGLEKYAFQGPGKIPYLGDPAKYGAEGLFSWRNAGSTFVAGPDYALGFPVRQLFKGA